MGLNVTELQKDNLFSLLNQVEDAEELTCHLGGEMSKTQSKSISRLMKRRAEAGGIWDLDQVSDLVAKEPEFYSYLFNQSRHAFVSNAMPSAISNLSAFPIITFGVFFEIKWGKWPKNWGDQRTHFAIEVHFKQMALQGRLDGAEKDIKSGEANLEKVKQQPQSNSRDIAIANVKEAIAKAKARKKAVEREIDDIKKARKAGNHKRMAEIVVGNIKKKITAIEDQKKLITGTDKKSKAARAKLSQEIKGLMQDISKVNRDVEKLK